MPQPTKPKLVNRGGAGLYKKLTKAERAGIVPIKEPDKPILSAPKARYQIAPSLVKLAVDVNSVIYDPDNANLHPENSIAAIKESLTTYGQVKPIVVQKSTMHVVAGNGTLQCARELGWKRIAACIVEMSDAEATGYGLADNRVARLAKWDFETDVLQRLYAKVTAAGLPMTGWAEHELIVMRMADWIPPEQTTEDFQDGLGNVTIKCTGSQYCKVDEALNEIHNDLVLNGELSGDKELTDAEYLVLLSSQWLETRRNKVQ